MSVRGRRTLERAKQGIVLGWNIPVALPPFLNSTREAATTNYIKGIEWEGGVVSSREMGRGNCLLEFITGHVVTARHEDLVTCSCTIIAGILSTCFHTGPAFTERFSPQRGIAAQLGLCSNFPSRGCIWPVQLFTWSQKIKTFHRCSESHL